MPKISVIIPCYNQAHFLDEAVESVLAQTFQDFEIIIVDDGSDDESSVNILNNYEKPKTKIIRTSNNGPSIARNMGIESAMGEYILPIDADDKIHAEYLEKAAHILDKNPKIGIVYCEAELFGDKSGKWNLPEHKFPHILLANCIFCTAMFRKSDWLDVGGYKAEMEHSSEDWEFWLSLIEKGLEVYRIPEILFYYRIKTSSRTTQSLKDHELEMRMKLLEFHKELYEDNLEFIIDSYYELKVLQNELKRKLNQKNRQLRRIKSSRSWKLTYPIRKVGVFLRKFRK